MTMDVFIDFFFFFSPKFTFLVWCWWSSRWRQKCLGNTGFKRWYWLLSSLQTSLCAKGFFTS